MDPQATTGQADPGADREARMKEAGFTRLDLPEGMHQISTRGGHMLSTPSMGDAVDLYTDNPDSGTKDRGLWVPGFVACSDTMQGEMGGPYSDQDVLLVCKAEDYDEDYQGAQGQEWPTQYVRLAKEQGNGLVDKTEEQDPEDPEATPFSIGILADNTIMGYAGVATFYSPLQARGYHGKWIEEGKGDDKVARIGIPYEGMTEKRWEGQEEWAKEHGLSKQVIKERVRARVKALPPEAQNWKRWYFEAHDLAEQYAQETGVSETAMAIVFAALSPKSPWRDDDTSEAKLKMTNQVQAYKLGMLVGKGKNEVINITPAMAAAMNSPAVGDKYRINVEKYDGRDTMFKQGTNYLGRHKVADLPADIVITVLRPRLHIMGDSGLNALRGARLLDPSELGGPKTRSFYNNIRFPTTSDDATIDIHMARVLTGKLDLLPNEVTDLTAKPGVYKMLSDAVREVAHEMGWLPHELQAALWKQQKELYKAADVTRAIDARIVKLNEERVKQGLKPITAKTAKGSGMYARPN